MPAANTVHIDRLATAVGEAYKNEKFEYIADEICPPVSVKNKSDLYPKWPLATFFRRPTKRPGGLKRAPTTDFVRRDYNVGTASYETEQFGIEHALDWTTKKNADQAFRVEQIPIELTTEDLLRDKELRTRDLLTSTANLTQNITLAGASRWDDVNSPIVDHFEDAAAAVKDGCGRLPNLIEIPFKVWRYVKHHPELIERLKYKDRAKATLSPANLEEIFSGSFAPNTKILIPSAVYDEAMEGADEDDPTLVPIWTDVVIGYVDPSPALGRPTLCNAPEFIPFMIGRYTEEKRTSDVFRALEDRKEQIVEARCGYLIKTPITP